MIGSAAMALHGAGPIEVGDIDLLMSRPDAARLLGARGVPSGPGSKHERFRSDVFGRIRLGGYTVEVFGGFHVLAGGAWRELVPGSRVAMPIEEKALFIPSVAELIGMGRLFGRPKDAEREELLLRLSAGTAGSCDTGRA